MNEAREAYMTRVEAEGCRVVLPCECQLQIDIDSADHYEVFLQSARVVLRNWDCATDITIEDRPSRCRLPFNRGSASHCRLRSGPIQCANFFRQPD